MFLKTADVLTHKLRRNNLINSEQFEICKFGIKQMLNILLNISTTIVIGVFFHEVCISLLFLALYIPLRSYAGGYHAKTELQCYISSILLMITVLLATKYVYLSCFVCIIMFLISCIAILLIAPVEDSNKPLDDLEKKVYKRRTMMIVTVETVVFMVSILLNADSIYQCLVWVYISMTVMLYMGKCKNIAICSKISR